MPAFIFSKTHMGRNMHSKEYNLEPMAKFSDLIPSSERFWSWVKKTFTPSYQEEIDSYFKDCIDHADIERVMINLQRRGML
jgi:hypothetical protein